MTDVLTVDGSGNVTATGDIEGANLSGTNTGDQSDATLNFSDITTNNSSTSQHGFLKKLDNNSAHYMDGTGNWSAPAGPGLATTSTPGIVKPDGATIDVSSGVISVPTATTSLLGLVKPDGATIDVSSGTISVPTATTSLLGLVKTDGSTLTNSSGAIAVATATTSQLGAVKPDGSTIAVSSGVISVPTATTSALGLVKPDGVSIGVSAGLISTLNNGLYSGFVNLIRNSQCNAGQRGTTGNVSTSAAGYTVDGWMALATGASSTWTQEAAVAIANSAAASNNLLIAGAASNTGTTLTWRIESLDAAKIDNQKVTFSAWIVNNSGASLTPTLTTKVAGSSDNWTSPTTDLSSTNLQAIANGSTGAVSYTFTASGNAYLGYELILGLAGMTSSADSIAIAAPDFRLTPGLSTGLNSTPPAPEIAPVAIEWPRNKRYLDGFGETVGAVGIAYATSATAFGIYIPFKTKMRTKPTGITVGTVGNLGLYTMAGAPLTALLGLSFGSASEDGIFLTGTTGAALTAGVIYFLNVSTALAGNVIFTGAEL